MSASSALLQTAADIIQSSAESLRASHTVLGTWPECEREARERYEFEMDVAGQLIQAAEEIEE